MKRLILMGGRPWETEDRGKYFTRVLFRYFPVQLKMALCIFAQPENDWNETQQVNAAMFNRFKGKRTLSFRTMTAENFKELSKWADVIYIPGGNPFTLMNQLKDQGDLKQLWDGKVIAGSSAGADLFCAGFAFLQDKTFGKGLGWIPATCIPHWRDNFKDYTAVDWDWAEKESLKQFPNLPVLCIPEGKFVELSVN